MKKNLKKPLKSLMLTAMALLTATATAVNATSYVTIKVEHIWEDNNNAYGTRPGEVTVDINQVQGKDPEGKDKVITDNFTTVTDDGSTAGQKAASDADKADKSKDDVLAEAGKKGQEAGVQAGADAKDKLDGLEVPDPENLKKPGDLVNPDDLVKPEELKDYTGADGKKYQYSEAEKKAYQEKLNEYRDAYEAYKGSEGETGTYEAYQAAYKNLLDYVKEYSKAENSASRPGGNDQGFLNSFLENFGDGTLTEEQLKEAYENGFNQGYDAGYSGSEKPEIKGDDRDELVAEIGDKIDNLVEGTGTDTAKDILDTVNKIIGGSETENVWFEEQKLESGAEKNDAGALNYRADMEEHPVEANKDFLRDTLGIDDETLEDIGYTTKQLKIEITIVEDKDENGNSTGTQRIYVSVDGGKNFTGVNTDQEYDAAKDVLEEVKFTFLHTLNVPYAPPEVDRIREPEPPEPPKPTDPKDKDPKDPKDPETPIPEEEVPLTDVEEEPEEEEIPEEEVPLTDVPKTGDNSLLWMCAAMFSGTALLALLKKEKEAQEA